MEISETTFRSAAGDWTLTVKGLTPGANVFHDMLTYYGIPTEEDGATIIVIPNKLLRRVLDIDEPMTRLLDHLEDDEAIMTWDDDGNISYHHRICYLDEIAARAARRVCYYPPMTSLTNKQEYLQYSIDHNRAYKAGNYSSYGPLVYLHELSPLLELRPS